MTRAGPAAERGFTLVEVLVAMTLLVLIAAGLLGALRAMGASAERVERVAERVEHMQIVSGFLRRALESAVPAADWLAEADDPPDASGSRGAPPTRFRGSTRSLEWVGRLPVEHGIRGMHYFDLQLRGDALVLRYRPYGRLMAGGRDGFREHVLAREVDALRIEYRAPDPAAAWVERWPEAEQAGVPGWVRLSLRVGDRHWPDLVVAVREVQP